MDKALFEAGIATRKEVLGTDYVGRAFEENALTDMPGAQSGLDQTFHARHAACSTSRC